MKIEREQRQMVVALVVVAAIATLILGLMDMATRGPIAEARRAALHNALVQVLPEHTNDPLSDGVTLEHNGKSTRFHLARNAEQQVTGIAWEQVAPDGYAGSIHILIGVRPDGTIHAIRITEHRETPGLGDGIVLNHAWLAAFHDQSLQSARWGVKKDGGDFDQFTGATITPRAVVKAVEQGLKLFNAHQEQLHSAADNKIDGGADE